MRNETRRLDLDRKKSLVSCEGRIVVWKKPGQKGFNEGVGGVEMGVVSINHF